MENIFKMIASSDISMILINYKAKKGDETVKINDDNNWQNASHFKILYFTSQQQDDNINQ